MFVIDDIIWLDAIIEKLIWKHQVLTSEVEEVLASQCRIFKKNLGRWKESISIMHWVGPKGGGIYPYFLFGS
jgi:hypothetical protein